MKTPARHEGPGDIWRSLFEGLADGCAYCRMIYADGEPVDWTYLAVNPAFTTLTGLRDVVGRNISELMPGLRASSPDLFEAYGRVARTGVAEAIESYVETLGIRLAIHLISPGPGHFIAIFRDSTAEARAQETARQSEQRFRTLFDLSPDPASLSRSADGTLLMVNQAWSELTGIPPEEAIGHSPASLGAWAEPEEREAMLSELFRTGRTGTRRSTLRQRDGSERRMVVTAKVLPMGKEDEILITGKDVTEFHDLSAALEERTRSLQLSEAQLRMLIDRAPLGIAMVDSASGRFLSVNPRMGEILGYAPGELLDADFQSVTHPDHLEDDLRSVATLASGAVSEIDKEKRYLHRSGREIRARLRMVSLPAAAGEPARHLALVEDITEAHLAEAERSRLQQRSYQAQKMESLETLVAGVAHNINNVLAIIMGTASWREPLAGQPADQEAYQSINRACLRGRDVVKSLIQFSKPTLAAQAPFELHTLITQVCTFLGNTGGNKVQILAMGLEEPMWVRGDAGSLNHALVNLCCNAMEAMPEGGTLTLRAALAEPGWIELTVEDTGCGMAPEVLAHVLEPFYTTKGGNSGAGLGLSIVHGVVKAHGGSIDIASQPGQGTSVRLRIPRIPAPVQAEAPRSAGTLPRLGKVLLVDDEEDVRFLMARMLTRAGVGLVETAASGEEALARLRPDALPDLIILDQNMPGMSGVQVMERVRALYPELPILFSSGQPDIETWQRLRQPRVAVISKPFTMEEIHAKLALI